MPDPYVPIVFEPWPSKATPITAARMNQIQAVVVQTAADAGASALSAASAQVAAENAAALVETPVDAVVAGMVGNPATATSASIVSTITGQTVNTFAPIRPSSALLGFFAALAQRDTQPVDIVCLGDSIFEGHSATTLAKRNVSRLVTTLRTRLGVATGGVGFIPARYGAPDRLAADGWTTTGRVTDNSYGLGQRSRSLLLDGGTSLGDGTMTRTLAACTSFSLLAHRHATSNTSLFVSVDGGADAVWDIPTGAGVISWSSGALTAGSHTVRVKARSNSGAYFEGVMVFNGDETSGIRLWEGARSGTRADQYNAESDANNALWADSLTHMTPDLVIVEWITNDATLRTSAQYEASVRAVVALVRSKAPNVPVLLLAMYERGGAALIEPWVNYTARLAEIAGDTPQVAFFDLGRAIPKLNGADTYGLLSDGTHPNDKGHALIGDLLAGYLLPQ